MGVPSPLLPEIDFAHHAVPDLHGIYDRLRAEGPVVPVCYHGQPTWLIAGHAELARAFGDEQHFQSADFAAYLKPLLDERRVRPMG